MRLLLPAVLALLAVAGAALEESPRPRLATALVAIFAIRGGLVAASHNDFFFQALPAATGIEPEEDYLRRKFPPAALYARAERELPANARVLAINEVRLFRFPRPVTASRVVDPPALRPFMTGARDVPTVAARLRRAGITHLLVATHPSEGGSGSPMTHDEAILTRALIHESRIVDREGAHALFQLP